ncbi:MAG: GAF domain-containing protein [Bacteroidota bacterium]
MKKPTNPDPTSLRQKAEKLLDTERSRSVPLTESDTLKLIHELEVHQIELKLQNEELKLARSAALLTAEKFTELYDFSPTSYFSLSKDGRIVELNLGGAKMLGKERSLLTKKLFGLFVSQDTKQRFNLFLKEVFTVNTKETCEVTLAPDGGVQMHVLLTGIATENGKQCLISAFDITERRRLDSILKTRNSILEASYNCSLNELLQKTLDEVEALSKSKISFFHFVDEDQVTLSLQTWSTNTMLKMCNADGKGQHYPIDQAGVWTDCIGARSPVIHNDYLSLPHRKGLPEGHAPVIRELVVPIFRNEKIVAILGVGNKESHYDQTDVQSISEIADITWDIVERTKWDEELKQSNVFSHSLLQTIPFGMDIVDEQGNLLFLSNNLKQHFGEVALGTKCWNLYRDDKKQCSDCPLHTGITIGETKMYEAHGVLGGKIFEVYHTGMVFNGQKAMLEVFLDITERKLAEESMRTWNTRFKKLSENAPGLIFQFTRKPDGTYFVPIASEGIRNIFGCSPEDVIDDFAPIGRVIYPEDSARVISDIEFSAKHLTYFACEFRVQIPGKEIQWIYSKSTPEKLPDGSITWYGFDTDITSNKQKEKDILDLNRDLDLRVKQRTSELEKAVKELEAFSYSVSHDLKTPLRHISGFIGLFLDSKPKELSVEQLGFLQVISSSTLDMEKLIDGILAFSRLNSIGLRKTRICSSEMVQKVIKFFDPETQNRKISYHVENLPDVYGDYELIRQVWTNLISNAVKYTMKKAEAVIEIGSISTDEEISFYIKDNGAGFNMKYAEKLFGVFQRLHKTRDFEGVGIGLANVNRIVTRHGGLFRAEGEVDHGATFYFSLPK